MKKLRNNFSSERNKRILVDGIDEKWYTDVQKAVERPPKNST